MPTVSKESPASLYAPVSLVLGIIAAVTAVISGFIGMAIPFLAGSLAVTFAVLGLVYRTNGTASLIGLIGGAVGVLYPVFLISTLSA